MRVLTITGDVSFKEGHPRFDLQVSVVEHLEALYWGPGALWPQVPKGKFDVVTVQDPFFRGLIGVFLARQLKARLNVQVHADIEAQGFIKRAIARFVFPHADSVRCVSEKTRMQAKELGAQNITVLPIYIDIERYRRIQRTPEATLLILWIGRFEEEKDPLRAIEIFKEVQKDVPNAKLIMLGDGSLRVRLQNAAQNLPVEFPGWQADVAPYLSRAHVTLSTSRSESYGASIIEALAAGVPVVAPDVGVAREAGAMVVEKDKLTEAVVETLNTKNAGVLKLPLLSESEWLSKWRDSL